MAHAPGTRGESSAQLARQLVRDEDSETIAESTMRDVHRAASKPAENKKPIEPPSLSVIAAILFLIVSVSFSVYTKMNKPKSPQTEQFEDPYSSQSGDESLTPDAKGRARGTEPGFELPADPRFHGHGS